MERSLKKSFEGFATRLLGPEIYKEEYTPEQVGQIAQLKERFDVRAAQSRNKHLAQARNIIMSTITSGILTLPGFGQETPTHLESIEDTPVYVRPNIDVRDPKSYLFDLDKEKHEAPSIVRTDTLSNADLKEFMNESPAFGAELLSRPEDLPSAFAEYEAIKKQYDDVRSWSKGLIMSPTYQQRLTHELKESGLTGAETFYSQKRLFNLMETDYRMQTAEEIELEHKAAEAYYEPVTYSEPKEAGITILRSPSEGQATLPYEKNVFVESIAAHEFEHESMDANKNLNLHHPDEGLEVVTPYAKQLYKEGLNYETIETMSEKLLAKGMPQEELERIVSYYSSSTELQAYKKGATYELKQLGIWDYTEEFTEKKYQEAMDYVDARIKSKNVDGPSNLFVFFKLMKKEYAIKILNEIA